MVALRSQGKALRTTAEGEGRRPASSASSNTPGPTSLISTEPSARGSPTRRPR